MTKLDIQKYLRQSSVESFKGLKGLKEDYGIKYSFGTTFQELICFKYNQIESPMGEKIVQECRGIILNIQDNWKVVSRPYDKFFNYGQGHAALIDWNTAKVYDKLDGCFLRNQHIDCWDGSFVKIGDIVDKGLRPVLIGQDKQGNLIPSYITNVKNNGTKNNWLEITLEDKIQTSKQKRSNKLKVTSNHHIFLKDDYIEAGKLKEGDCLTSYEQSINNFLKEYIEGSLLGDGYLTSQGSFSETHLAKLTNFISWQKACLGSLYTSCYFQKSGYDSDMCKVKSIVNPYLKILKDKWYPNAKKIVPLDLKLTNLSVAKWFLDDGSRVHSSKQNDRACFATNSFTEKECLFLANQLEQMYGVSTTVYDSKGFNIRINYCKNTINNFWKAISPYIPFDMEYKVPEKYRSIPKIIPTPMITRVKKLIPIVKIEELQNNKTNFPSGRKGFDIETTTNNYFAGGLLVHNSLMTLYFYKGKWRVQTSGTVDAECQVGGYDITFKELFWEVFTELNYLIPAHSDKDYCFMFELMTPLNRIVVRHPENKLVLHGARNVLTGKYQPIKYWADKYNWECCRTFDLQSLEDVISCSNNLDPLEQEGYIVEDAQYNRVKIKSPSYVALHHAKDTISPRSILNIIRTNESTEFLNYFEEYAKIFKEVEDKYNLLILKIEEVIKNIYLKNIQTDYKAVGLYSKELFFKGALFQILKNNISIREYLKNIPLKKLEEWINK